MLEKKISYLALLKVLEEDSDENHILSQPELLTILETKYNVKLDRRTLYKNIESLKDFGYDISSFSDNGKGYYLRERNFEKSEIFLLCNAIHSSNFIPNSSSKDLIDKLLSTQSKYYRSSFKNTVFIENKQKKENKEFFLNLELLEEAIRNKKTVSFNYTRYNTSKQLINRREELYHLCPYYLVYELGKTYLIGYSISHNDYAHYRVDRMKNIEFTSEPYIKANKSIDPYDYSKNKTYMYKGDIEVIKLKCDYSILDDIIDVFGKDIKIIEHKDYFICELSGTKEGMLYYCLQYLKHIEVLEPVSLRNEIKQCLIERLEIYR